METYDTSDTSEHCNYISLFFLAVSLKSITIINTILQKKRN